MIGKKLLLHQKAKHFFWAVHAYDQCFFYVGSAAGAGGKRNQRRQLRIFKLNMLQSIANIIYQLAGVRNANVYRRINAYRASALLCGTHYNTAGTRNQLLAGSNGGIAVSKVFCISKSKIVLG